MYIDMHVLICVSVSFSQSGTSGTNIEMPISQLEKCEYLESRLIHEYEFQICN